MGFLFKIHYEYTAKFSHNVSQVLPFLNENLKPIFGLLSTNTKRHRRGVFVIVTSSTNTHANYCLTHKVYKESWFIG